MSEFKREERYIVVKLKHLAGLQIAPLRNFLRENRVPTLDCVVVESDWPEYEKVWQSIERRMTGQPAVTAAEELDAVLHWRGKHAKAIRERDEVKETLERWHELNLQREAKVDALQQRLTAADERWDELVSAVRSINRSPHYMVKAIDDDQPQYRQRKEWIDWVLGLCDTPLKPTEGGKPSTCTWSEGGFSWHTGCGKEWQFTDGGLPAENGMRFCHSCGKTLVVSEDQSESEQAS